MPHRSKAFLIWAYLSLLTNGLLIYLLAMMLMRQQGFFVESQASASIAQFKSPPTLESGPRHKLNYDEWVALLQQEATAIADNKPQKLSILLGDSLSLWFPNSLLPDGIVWLNQGISGETSRGLLSRLKLLDQTQPESIFLMIGINDLLRGVDDETVLQNTARILDYLRSTHPRTRIILQSILPHAGDRTTWEGRERLKFVSNVRIRKLNRQLAELCVRKSVYYLELHPLFTDSQGDLRPELTTDGLHLSTQGYWVWRSAILMFTQSELEQHPTQTQSSGIGG